MDNPHANHPVRSHPAHGILAIPNQPTIIFDTICTHSRKAWLANPTVHEHLRHIWQNATEWKVGRYVLMPDHVHMFVADCGSSVPYENWVRYWKSMFSRTHKASDDRWQSEHWDRRIRSVEQLEEKWDYIVQNPVRSQLVSDSKDWPFQGEIFEFRWE